MRIERIIASNFMGANFTHDLHPVTVIVGKNMRGKGRVVKACQFVLGGFVPGCPRKNADLLELLGNGNTVEAKVRLGGEIAFGRRLFKTKKGVSLESGGQGLDDDWAVPPVSLDAGEYLSLPSRDRVAFLFNALTLPDGVFSYESLVAEVKNVKAEVNTEHTEQVLKEVLTDVATSHKERKIGVETDQEWLDSVVKDLMERYAEANAAAKRMAGTQQGMVEMQAQADEVINPAVEGELDEARKALRKLALEVDVAGRRQKDNDKRRARRLELEVHKGKQKVDQSALVASLGAEVATLRGRISTYKSQTRALTEPKTKLSAELAVAQSKIESKEQDIKQASTKQAELLSHRLCPTCGMEGEAWRASAVKAHSADQKQRRTELEQIKAAQADVQQALDAATNALKDSQAKDDEIRLAGESADRKQRQMDQVRQAAAADESMATELESLKAVPTAEVDAEDLRMVEAAASNGAKKVAALEGQFNQLSAQRGRAQAQADAQEKTELNKAEVEVVKKCVEVVTAYRKKMIDATVGPFIALVNRIALPILERPLAYREGAIGFVDRDTNCFQAFSPLFSGTERAMTLAALSIGLAAQSPVKIVFFEELGVMEPTRRQRLVELAMKLVEENVLDQFVGNDSDPAPYMAMDASKFKIINLQ